MIASFDATKKAVISAEQRGASRPGAQGILRAFSLSTAGERRLGALLWSLKYGSPPRRAEAFAAAALLLLHRFARRGGPMPAICAAALTEWLHDQCGKCRGRGRTGAGREIVESKRIPCPSCRGAGRLFSPSSRWAHYATSGALVGNEIPPESVREGPCGPCAGRGWRTITERRNSRLRACLACRGTGLRVWRNKDRTTALRMTGEQFARWRPAYLEALRQLRALDIETALRVDFRRGFGENPDYLEGMIPQPRSSGEEEEQRAS